MIAGEILTNKQTEAQLTPEILSLDMLVGFIQILCQSATAHHPLQSRNYLGTETDSGFNIELNYVPGLNSECLCSLEISLNWRENIEFEVGLQALFVFGWFFTRIDSEEKISKLYLIPCITVFLT